jgi:hypothetical protein
MIYFNNQWNLPYPSTTMEGIGNHSMVMPFSTTEIAYTIVQQSSSDLDPNPTQELDLVLEPIWAQGLLLDTNYLYFGLQSYEVIIEEITSLDRLLDDLHHRSYFLPELRRIEAREFTLNMIGDRACPINPLATHIVYAEGNMETIAKMIPIDISKILHVVENIFIGADCSPEEI